MSAASDFTSDLVGGITGQTQSEAIEKGTKLNIQQIEQGIKDLNRGFGQTELRFGEAQQLFDPFMQQGGQAFQLQSALSGAMGPEAQAEAFQNFQSSPQQKFLQSQGEEAILRNAAATGELGGANTQKALMQFGQGLASQDFQQQFQNLGGLAQQGLGAAGMSSQLTQGLGQMRSNLGTNIANLRAGIGQAQSEGLQGQANAQAEGAGNILGIGAAMLSDVRLKENIELAGNVNGVNLYTWDWNETGKDLGMSGKGFGVIAQEIEKTHPEYVIDGKYKQIKTELFTALGVL